MGVIEPYIGGLFLIVKKYNMYTLQELKIESVENIDQSNFLKNC